ncbi:inositol monophosphatase family protein [Rhizomonospora bruguierae]|uniref:inositol monophosphatase family protein n=1 Tax=Rhizomonospora bruguierae TaxID=1581705 RepID=UPI0024BE8814|nr:inositol monophosphatase family protein [Micromonospora sp. NBRC 107566]
MGPAPRQRLAHLVEHGRVRMNGSAAVDLSWLAEGKLDASVTLANHPWDVAAGVVIAREAGAIIMDQDGSEHTLGSRATIAATPGISRELLALLGRAEAATATSTTW